MRTRIHIRLVPALAVGVVLVSTVIAQNEQRLQYRLANEASEVPYGSVRLAENITTVVVRGENGSFIRTPENGVIKLPVGAYRVDAWIIAKRDEAGARWELRATLRPGSPGGFTVARDKEARLPFGEPVYSIVAASRSGSIYSFGHRLEGRQGEQIVLTRNGSLPLPPRLRIRSRDGTYDRSFSFAYG